MSINKVILIGRLGKDPEIRFLPDGSLVANFSVATGEKWMDKTTGEKRESTEWHRIVAFQGLAKVAQDYLRKGMQVYIEGKLKTRKYNTDGIDRYITEIHASTMNMLESKNAQQGEPQDSMYQGESQQGNANYHAEQTNVPPQNATQPADSFNPAPDTPF